MSIAIIEERVTFRAYITELSIHLMFFLSVTGPQNANIPVFCGHVRYADIYISIFLQITYIF